MTQYFDDISLKLTSAAGDPHSCWKTIEDLEGRLVFDCTVCSQVPGFPLELQLLINQAVLRYGYGTLPVSSPPIEPLPLPDLRRRILQLCSELHTIFHTLAVSEIHGFSDNPKLPQCVLYAIGDQQREEMVAGSES